jgi:hypothetical protein
VIQIPRIAFFYWTGGSLPWLRQKALTSFQRLHPDWEVVLCSPEPREPPPGVRFELDRITNPNLAPAARSDVWRWNTLAKHGGFYADTDVIFVKNVEPIFEEDKDVWVTCDLGTPIPYYGWISDSLTRRKAKFSLSIGVVASKPGAPFFLRLAQLARATPPSDDYQSHGTRLMVKHWKDLQQDTRFGEIPAATFYGKGSAGTHVRELWKPGRLTSPFGLHWYGGSLESAAYLNVQSIDQLPDCLVKSALRVTEGYNG